MQFKKETIFYINVINMELVWFISRIYLFHHSLLPTISWKRWTRMGLCPELLQLHACDGNCPLPHAQLLVWPHANAYVWISF
jgi:hypothetical protein